MPLEKPKAVRVIFDEEDLAYLLRGGVVEKTGRATATDQPMIVRVGLARDVDIDAMKRAVTDAMLARGAIPAGPAPPPETPT